MTTSHDRLSHATLEQAAQWYVLLHDELGSGAVREQWQQWLEQHVEHRAAWLYVERVSARFAPLRSEGAQAGPLLRKRGQAAFNRRQAVKALLLLGGVSLGTLGGWNLAARNGWMAELRTGTAEQRKVLLADGSTLWLGACSAVDTDFSGPQRRLTLLFGEALLESSANDSRPLRLETDCGHLQVQSLPLRLAVHHQPGLTRLNLYQGTVAVQPRLATTQRLLHGGQGLDFSATTLHATQPAQSAADAWLHERLIAEAMPLGYLLEQLRRYRHGHLGYHPAIAELPVMGTFPLDDTDQALRLLEAALPVRVERLTDWWITVKPA